MKTICLFLVFFSLQCSHISSTDKEKEIATRAILVSTITAPVPSTSCEVTSPAFVSLKNAGFDTSCGRSGCHDGTTRFNTTNYAQVRALTNPSSPTTSFLYTQTKGSMAIYSNANLDKAIFCWIQGGSNP